jgi:hypothetical protein
MWIDFSGYATYRELAPIGAEVSMYDSIDARVSVLEDSQRTEEGLPFLQECALRFLVLAAVSSNGAAQPSVLNLRLAVQFFLDIRFAL